EPVAVASSWRVGAAVAAQVDGDEPERVAQPKRERLEQPGAQPVRVQQQERRAVAAPVERGDVQAVVLDRDLAGTAQAGSAARISPSLRSCGVAPPSVSSSSLAHRKYRCNG